MSLEIFLIDLLCSNFIVILKDSENPYKSLLLTKNPVGIPYSLRKAKNPYCREKSLRVAALKQAKQINASMITNSGTRVFFIRVARLFLIFVSLL